MPTDEQAFLLAYRPLCKELYLKERQLESLEIAKQGGRRGSVIAQRAMEEYIDGAEIGIQTALRDLRSHKGRFDTDLLAANYDQIRYVAIHLDTAPDLMCSGYAQPQYSFEGEVIQDLDDLGRESQGISFSLAATERGGVGVFAWRSESDASSYTLVESLLRLSPESMPHALLRYAASEFENSYFRPEWWERLNEEDKNILVDRFHHGVGPQNLPHRAYLMDDGRRLVTWSIECVTQKRN
jgi:hypothetical protein